MDKTFPDEFYETFTSSISAHGLECPRTATAWSHTTTNDLVYERLAPGSSCRTRKEEPKDEKGRRPIKNFQWLTLEVEHPMLAQHLYSLMMFQRLAFPTVTDENAM